MAKGVTDVGRGPLFQDPVDLDQQRLPVDQLEELGGVAAGTGAGFDFSPHAGQ